MVFSGDDDSVCATQGTGLWIARQPWEVKENQEWMAWCVPYGRGCDLANWLIHQSVD
jgi:hypothetical protein